MHKAGDGIEVVGDLDVGIVEHGHAEADADAAGELAVDQSKAHQHALDDGGNVDLAELEREGVDDVVLLGLGHAVPEQRRLARTRRRARGRGPSALATGRGTWT